MGGRKTTNDVSGISKKVSPKRRSLNDPNPKVAAAAVRERLELIEKIVRYCNEHSNCLGDLGDIDMNKPGTALDEALEGLKVAPAPQHYSHTQPKSGRIIETMHRNEKFHRRNLLVDRSDSLNPIVLGDYAVLNNHNENQMRPGTVIYAVHAFANNDLHLAYPNDQVRIFGCGPVFAKKRPMIVLWRHGDKLVCLPLFTHSGRHPKTGVKESGLALAGMSKKIRERIMPVRSIGSKWDGFDSVLFNGPPLNLEMMAGGKGLGDGRFVDLDRTVSINQSEEFESPKARLTRGSYIRLVWAFMYREGLARTDAFSKLTLNDPFFWLGKAGSQPMHIATHFWKSMGLNDSEINTENWYSSSKI